MNMNALARPLMIPSIPGKQIYTPFVQAQCGEVYDVSQASTVTYPHDQLKGLNSTLNRWELKPPFDSFGETQILFDWIDLSDVAGTDKVIGATSNCLSVGRRQKTAAFDTVFGVVPTLRSERLSRRP